MIRAPRGFARTAFKVKRYCEPPRRYDALLMLNAPFDSGGRTVTLTRLRSVSVRPIVTTRFRAPCAMLTVAAQ
jgi:hypothetical protein